MGPNDRILLILDLDERLIFAAERELVRSPDERASHREAGLEEAFMRRPTEARLYRFVGSAEISKRAANQPASRPLGSLNELLDRLDLLGFQQRIGSLLTVTFVIDAQGRLRIADRRSEHVACAGHGEVMSAGEMTFGWSDDGCVVAHVTNQSTGYCPEAESWAAVAYCLNELSVPIPAGFAPECIFRRCNSCNQINIVKDDWFVCSNCGAILPKLWNFAEKGQ